MEILAYNFKTAKARKGFKKSVMIVRMDREEALKTIKSLSSQLVSGNCNAERWESYDINGVDFSISVSL